MKPIRRYCVACTAGRLPWLHFVSAPGGVSDTDPNPCAHLQIIMSEKQARVLFGDGDYQ